MRTPWLIFVACSSLVVGALGVGCGGGNDGKNKNPQCSDGIDNDGDGLVDFPDDPGCVSAEDDTENSLPSPQCSDGRDNDGDGKIDFPYDPGCLTPLQDSETDDCPDGPNCPQCSNNKDDDGNGITDYPDDPGCTSASDNDEFTDNPAACGADVLPLQLPFDGHVMGMIDPAAISHLSSTTCGGGGGEQVYELRIQTPKVVTATTDLGGTNFDTVLYVRPADCANPSAELTCDDDAVGATNMGASSLAISLSTPGLYFLVVDSHDAGAGGNFELQVNFLAGEGQACTDNTGCGPTLVCRIPLGGTDKVCSKHVCSDGVDDDGDGKLDYPNDPGCDSPDDDDETDTCPGAGCPECADGIDNDGDGHTDYPDDTTCTSAADGSESCPSTDGVKTISAKSTAGDLSLSTVHDDVLNSCSLEPGSPDLTYRLNVPALASLTLSVDSATLFPTIELYGSTCGGTAVGGATVGCIEDGPVVEANLAAGSYYVVVEDSFGTDPEDFGPFTLNVSGTIKNAASCESPLFAAGVLTCATGHICKGTLGSRTCQATACSDGVDNNGDGKIDYPNDPGCDSPEDDAENTVCPGVNCPVCADGTDNDADGHIDFATDLSCWAASGTSEAFCNTIAETDRALRITTPTTTGTTAALHSNVAAESCQANASGNDVAFSITLPVPVTTITFDTNGSAFDTILSLRNNTCATEILCDDDGGAGTQSLITQTNLAAGDYALYLDGYNAGNGAFSVNVHGSVANGTACTSQLFTTGVLSCTAPATCTAGTCQ